MKIPPPDPIINAINEGIRRSINVVIKNECYQATIILIFAGIDAMAHLNRPASNHYNDADDFKEWVQKYLDLGGRTPITPDEWWAARNAIFHTYGAYSKLHERSGVRVIGWLVSQKEKVRFDPNTHPEVVFINIPSFKDAFFKGMETFLMRGFADPDQRDLLEERINELTMVFQDK
jgi:hypothetical protein